jgi:excisionase family DNA binding protein
VSTSAPRPPNPFLVPAADIGLGPLLLTVEQAGQVLAIGRTAVYALLGSGVLASVRIGRSRRIPLAALKDYVTRLAINDAPAQE